MTHLNQDKPTLGASVWLRPSHVEVDKGSVRWRYPDLDGPEGKHVDTLWTARDDGRILEDFLAISSTTDHVEAFCRQWGVPDLCKHGLPLSHRRAQPCTYRRARALNLSDDGPPMRTENVVRIADLRTAVEGVRAARDLARAMRPGRPRTTAEEEWTPLARWLDLDLWALTQGVGQKQALTSAVNIMLQWSAAGPRLTWLPEDGVPRLRTHVDGPLSAVLLRLASDVSGATEQSSIACHYCHQEYVPQRLPKVGQRACCGKLPCIKAKNTLNQKSRRAKRQTPTERKLTMTRGDESV